MAPSAPSSLSPSSRSVEKTASDAGGPELLGAAAEPDGALRAEDIALVKQILQRLRAHPNVPAGEKKQLERVLAYLENPPAPVVKAAPLSEEELLARLHARLESAARRHKDNRYARERLAKFQLLLGEPDKALARLRSLGLAGPDDLYTPLLMSYAYLTLGDYDNGQRMLRLLERTLNSRVSLRLSVPVLCSSVQAFRLYTPRPQGPVLPGEYVLAYVEMEGLHFRDEKNGEASCHLRFGVSIRDAVQNVLWEEKNYGDWEKTYRGRLKDMHTLVGVSIPRFLKPGRYQMVIEVHDQLGKRSGQTSTAFEVAPASSTTTR